MFVSSLNAKIFHQKVTQGKLDEKSLNDTAQSLISTTTPVFKNKEEKDQQAFLDYQLLKTTHGSNSAYIFQFQTPADNLKVEGTNQTFIKDPKLIKLISANPASPAPQALSPSELNTSDINLGFGKKGR